MKNDFFFSKEQGFLKLFFLNEIHQKKRTGVNFLLFVANCGKILFYNLFIIYFSKCETIVRFDVYACLDITVHCIAATSLKSSSFSLSHTFS
jgi:hypothetical protein